MPILLVFRCKDSNFNLLAKNIRLVGADPCDPTPQSWPVIEGTGLGPAVSFCEDQTTECLLTGFVITRSSGRIAGAVYCDGAGPTIAHCLIVGNRTTLESGAAVYCKNSKAVLTNCTIADNWVGQNGAALRLENSPVLVVNSIVWGNTPSQISAAGIRAPSIRYSCIVGGWPGPGNIAKDPLFAHVGRWVDGLHPDLTVSPHHPNAVWIAGDYHLQSQAGRWDASLRRWVQDAVTSPCVDAGDPGSPIGDEPSPNGGMIDMGAYGGTAEAAPEKHLRAIAKSARGKDRGRRLSLRTVFLPPRTAMPTERGIRLWRAETTLRSP